MDMVDAIVQHLHTNCDFDNSYFHYMLGLTHFVPIPMAFIFFGISYYSGEVYYLILSLGMGLDIILNYALTNMIGEPAPNPLCGGHTANPSFHTEHAFFLYTFMLLTQLFFKLKITSLEIFLLQIWVLLTWVATITLGYNSFNQAFYGSIIGSAAAFAFVYIIHIFWPETDDHIFQKWIRRANYASNVLQRRGSSNRETVLITESNVLDIIGQVNASRNELGGSTGVIPVDDRSLAKKLWEYFQSLPPPPSSSSSSTPPRSSSS
jgi:hypothetical protein